MAESEATTGERPLAGLGVLVTRPAHQTGRLAHLIERAGGTVVRFPTIEIAPPADPAALATVLERLDEFDLAIFVSPNAVERAFERLHARQRRWPAGLAAACVGQASARALAEVGLDAVAPTYRFDSEALLALPLLEQVAGKKIVIFRGDGGRDLLGATLEQRGARVTYAECYRRARPRADPRALIDAWDRGEIGIVSITSTAGLRNLYEILGDAGRERLARTPIVVLSEAQAEVCRQLGLATEPRVAAEASDEAILEAIKMWRLGGFSL